MTGAILLIAVFIVLLALGITVVWPIAVAAFTLVVHNIRHYFRHYHGHIHD